jgi:hypothetical protein
MDLEQNSAGILGLIGARKRANCASDDVAILGGLPQLLKFANVHHSPEDERHQKQGRRQKEKSVVSTKEARIWAS